MCAEETLGTGTPSCIADRRIDGFTFEVSSTAIHLKCRLFPCELAARLVRAQSSLRVCYALDTECIQIYYKVGAAPNILLHSPHHLSIKRSIAHGT